MATALSDAGSAWQAVVKAKVRVTRVNMEDSRRPVVVGAILAQ